MDYFRATAARPCWAAARTIFAAEKVIHERHTARAMMIFNFINAASRYHASPVKQQSQRVKIKQGEIAIIGVSLLTLTITPFVWFVSASAYRFSKVLIHCRV